MNRDEDFSNGEAGEHHLPDHPRLGDRSEKLSDTGYDQQVWRYTQTDRHGRKRTYIGYVTYVGGAEGERLRDELAVVIRDLLQWAVQRQRSENRTGRDGNDDAEKSR